MVESYNSSAGPSLAIPGTTPGTGRSSLSASVQIPLSSKELLAGQVVAGQRPRPLRVFDQINMVTEDLVRQTKLTAPIVAGQRIAFMGDMDGTASLLGLLASMGGPAPAHLTVLDFDERVLEMTVRVAQRYGFASHLTVALYNVFDPVPVSLSGESDWFYTNPPYGRHNDGQSVQLFLGRGSELVRPNRGSGFLIIPDDPARPWTRRVMRSTQLFLLRHGWQVREQLANMHRYSLDDDPTLQSSTLIVDRSPSLDGHPFPPVPFEGRSLCMESISNFYGRSVYPPYPDTIDSVGQPRFRPTRPVTH